MRESGDCTMRDRCQHGANVPHTYHSVETPSLPRLLPSFGRSQRVYVGRDGRMAFHQWRSPPPRSRAKMRHRHPRIPSFGLRWKSWVVPKTSELLQRREKKKEFASKANSERKEKRQLQHFSRPLHKARRISPFSPFSRSCPTGISTRKHIIVEKDVCALVLSAL